LLNRFFFGDLAEAYITNSVIKEIKDFEHRQILENKIQTGRLHIQDPTKQNLEKATKAAKKSNLSKTDIEVLALALDLNANLITDDLALQNASLKIGLQSQAVHYSIKELPKHNKIVSISESVYKKIVPQEKELNKIKKVNGLIVSKLEQTNLKLRLPVRKILMAGSASRQTHLKNTKDLDFFILFDLKVQEKDLEMYNRKLICVAFPKAKLRTEYSQHPYFKTKLFGFNIEFVPGYFITNISQKKSAVDRTPLHLEYLINKLSLDHVKDIRILKQILKNNLLYGGDLKNNGMPGYLTELLILHYGSLKDLFKAVYRWNNRVLIDHERKYNGTPKFDDRLVVIDPTDFERNVASAFSSRNYEIFKFIVKEFAVNPSNKFFFGDIYLQYIDKNELENAIVLEIIIPKHKTEDSLWGNVKAIAERVERKAKERFVSIKHKSVLVEKNKVYFVFSLDGKEIIHRGPLLTDNENQRIFKSKYKSTYTDANRIYTKIKICEKEKINIIKTLLSDLIKSPKQISLNKMKLSEENKKRLHKDFTYV